MIWKKGQFSCIDPLSGDRLVKVTMRKHSAVAYLKVHLHITHGEVCPGIPLPSPRPHRRGFCDCLLDGLGGVCFRTDLKQHQ
jgi:hypothetical protein